MTDTKKPPGLAVFIVYDKIYYDYKTLITALMA